MPAFEIKGLHVVDGEILPVQYELQDPNGNQAQDHSAFIVRSDADKTFYYYEQLDLEKLWIRACLSLGDPATADLQFTHLIFKAEYTTALGMDPVLVKKSISPKTKADIKNKLISAAAEYKVIDERKPALASVATAPIIPVVEEEYTGHLSIADRATLNSILLPSGFEKPAMTTDYTGTVQDWDDAWDRGLAHMLTTPLRYFEKKMPANIPDAIKDTLVAMLSFMNPGRINNYRFDRSATEDITAKPTIGHVYDDIQQFFYKMLKDSALCPAGELITLSPAFYSIKVGSLDEETPMINTGLSDAQYALAMNLVENYLTYEDRLRNYEAHLPTYYELFNEARSIESLNKLIHLLSVNTIKTDDEEAVLSDFYALTSISSDSPDITVFDEKYHEFMAFACQQLTERCDVLTSIKAGFLASQHQVTYIKGLSPHIEGSLIYSLPHEKVLELCEIPGFITDNNIEHIIQALPLTGLNPSILDGIQSVGLPTKLLRKWPSDYTNAFLELYGSDRLKVDVNNYSALSSGLIQFPTASWATLLKILGSQHLGAILGSQPRSSETGLISLLKILKEDRRLEFMKALNRALTYNSLKLIMRNFNELRAVLKEIPAESFPEFFNLFPEGYIAKFIGTIPILNTVLSGLSDAQKTPLTTHLGFDHIINMITTTENLVILLIRFPVAMKLPFVTALGAERLRAKVYNQYVLAQVLGSFSAEAKPAVLAMLGSDHIKSLFKDGPVYALSYLDTSKKLDFLTLLSASLDNKDIKFFFQNSDVLRDVLKDQSADSQQALLQMLGAEHISSLIKSSLQLGKVLAVLKDSSRTALFAQLGPARIEAWIHYAGDLRSILVSSPDERPDYLIDMLGPRIVDIMDRGGRSACYDVAPKQMKMIDRAYYYHSHYQMKRVFEPTDINASIESIFVRATEQRCFGLPLAYSNHIIIANTTIEKCKKNLSSEGMLKELHDRIDYIDRNGNSGLFSSFVGPKDDLAMRIMYCIEQLNYHISAVKPAVSALPQKKAWKQILPGGAYLGCATAVGIGLALAFSPVSMIGPLHLTVGAIIGVALAAAFIAMALYTIAMHELVPKKDFTDKGLFSSWSVFNKADAPNVGANMDVGANNRPAGPIRPVSM